MAAVCSIGSGSGQAFANSAPISNTQTVATHPAPNASAAVRDAASKIETEAELAAAGPAVRAYVQAVTKETVTVTKVAAGTRSPTASGAVSPNVSVGSPGCYYVDSYYNFTNVFGWTLASTTLHIDNWCWVYNLYGYWVIYSQPNGYFEVSTHWGYAYCGNDSWHSDWVFGGWEYADGGTTYFYPGVCSYPGIEPHMNLQMQVYGDGTYYSQSNS